jgi:hypothetical protein
VPHMAYGMLPSMQKTTVYLAAKPRSELPGWVGSWKNGPVTDAAEVRRAPAAV